MEKFRIGDLVTHALRGNGKVIAISVYGKIGVEYERASLAGHACRWISKQWGTSGKNGYCHWEEPDRITKRPALAFAVGQKVTHVEHGKGKIRLIDETVIPELPYYVKFKSFGIWCRESALTPREPRPWHDASEPPDDVRNVQVKLEDGRKWWGWYGTTTKRWRVMGDDVDESCLHDDDYYWGWEELVVAAWRELPKRLRKPQPEPIKNAPRETIEAVRKTEEEQRGLAVGDRVVFEGVIIDFDGTVAPYVVSGDGVHRHFFRSSELLRAPSEG